MDLQMIVIELTRIHWHTKAKVKEPFFVNPEHIVWFTSKMYEYEGMKDIEYTNLCLVGGYDFTVAETPKEIRSLIYYAEAGAE